MFLQPADRCAFCNKRKENSRTGKLQRLPDKKIVAHYNCMLYSPMVVSIDLQEDVEGFDFDIPSVLSEIKRGRKLLCSFCEKQGATAGCNVRSCPKTYHYPCLLKDKGSPSQDEYAVYCYEHKMEKMANDLQNEHKYEQSEANIILPIHSDGENKEVLPSTSVQQTSMGSGTGLEESVSSPQGKEVLSPGGLPQRKNLNSTPNKKRSSANQTLNWEDWPEMGEGWKRRINIRKSGKCTGQRDMFYLSPQGKQFRSKPQIETYLDKTLDSSLFNFKYRTKLPAEKKCNNRKRQKATVGCKVKSFKKNYYCSRVEKAKGSYQDGNVVYYAKRKSKKTANGSQQNPTIEMALAQDNKNDAMTTEDALNTGVAYMLSCSDRDDTDETPERLPDNHVHVSPSRSSTKQQHVTEEQPVSSPDEEIPDKTSASSKLPTRSSNSNIKDRPCMSPCDASSCSVDCTDIPDSLSSEFPDSTILLILQAMTTITGNSVEHAVGLSNDTGLPTQQINSTNSKETLSSQPTDCTNASKSIRPDTLVGCSSHFINKHPAQGTSETHPSGCPSVTEPESPFCSSLTLEKDRNKTEVSTSVSDVSQENMESDVSAPQCYNREILPVASPSNAKTLQNEKEGQNIGSISNIVSSEQITDNVSRKLVTGTPSEQHISIVSQMSSPQSVSKKASGKSHHLACKNCYTPLPDGSEQIYCNDCRPSNPSDILPSTRDIIIWMPSDIHSPNRNSPKDAEQRREDEAISEGSANPSTKDHPESTGNHLPLENQGSSEMDVVFQEGSKSITSKRKRSEDSEELLPNMNPQQIEGNSPEQLEIPEEQDEYNFRENATPGSVESRHAAIHQSGPSRMHTLVRRRLFEHERVGNLDENDEFGLVVEDQCRRMPQDRLAKYMSFVLDSAGLFCAPPTIPDIDILITNLRTVLERCQQSSP